MSAEIAPDEGPSFPDERQKRIAELIATRGKVRIGQLTELFGVSEPTVRKDLTNMEQPGLLKRTHGGAVTSGLLSSRPWQAGSRKTQKPSA